MPAPLADPPPVDVALRDGATVRIRASHAEDVAGLESLLEGMSVESRWLRFFTAGADVGRAAAMMAGLAPENGRGLIALTGTDERVVAHATYVREPGADRAEVAFEVADEMHGRGIATIMLGHLATLAEADGVATFTATVLPENRRMIGVFRDSGFDVEVRSAPGELEVAFPAVLGESARLTFEERDRAAAAAAVAHVLRPASIAVIGASARPGSVGAAVLANLRHGGFKGHMHLVHPRGVTIDGLASRSDVPDVELAVVAVPAAAVVEVARECAAAGVHALVVLSAGFAEIGPAGAARQAELLSVCRTAGMRLVGPNCLGVASTADDLAMNATFTPSPRRPDAWRSPRRAARTGSRRSPRHSGAASGCRASYRWATRPTSPATTSCTSGRATRAPTSSGSTSSRSATRADSAASPAAWPRASRSSR